MGIIEDVGMSVKFSYDHVFSATTVNQSVYKTIASPIVTSAMDGINGTVFAYGVTSSGKTFTMMGEESEPGIVPHTIAEVFQLIAKLPRKEFLLKMSMMEIYNEVINDLFDPTRTNLRLREDPKRGVYVENLKQETLLSAEHALQLIAMGNEHRKTSATAFNEGSSRSHTIIRISIEASDRADMTLDDTATVGRTMSFLNLIDLAGSESAKAQTQASHRLEGSFINKSLLTLGTVINKLSDGNAAHIPFRDSKLTRLLQSSLTGTGARVAVICTITPASTQAEETHNTLKFASRAKRITISAKRNEIMDQSSLIARYQQEISLLKGQLEVVMRDRKDGPIMHDPMHPEVRTLRERLEEEHAVLIEREKEKAMLERQLERLTACILHGAAALSHAQNEINVLSSEILCSDEAQAQLDEWLQEGKPVLDGLAIVHPGAAGSIVMSAGDVACSKAAMTASVSNPINSTAIERHVLRHQLVAFAEEIHDREKTIRALRQLLKAGAVDRADDEATQAFLEADRQYQLEKVKESEQQNIELAAALERMRAALASAKGLNAEDIDLEPFLDGSAAENGANPESETPPAALALRRGYDHVLAEKVLKMENQVALAIEALKKKEEKMASHNVVMSTLAHIDGVDSEQVEALSAENDNLRLELDRVEVQAAHLQGHDLDDLSNEELSELITMLGQSVERVRVTVQLRRLAGPSSKRPQSNGQISLLAMSGDRHGSPADGMTATQMKEAIQDLRKSGTSHSMMSPKELAF